MSNYRRQQQYQQQQQQEYQQEYQREYEGEDYFYDGNGGWGRSWESRDVSPWQNLSGGRRRATTEEEEEESDDDKDDEEGNPKSLKRVFVRFAERTSMQGVPYILASKVWPARLAWSVFLVGALVVLSLHLYLLINTYIAWPTYSVINLGYSQLKFPAVTLCNVNAVRKSQLHLANQDFVDFVNNLTPANIVTQLQKLPRPRQQNQQQNNTQATQASGRKRKKRFLEGVTLNYTNTRQGDAQTTKNEAAAANGMYSADKTTDREIEDEFKYLYNGHNRGVRTEMGHNLSSMLLSCSFSGRACSSTQFKLSTSPTHGNCYTLERRDFISSIGGPEDGLELLLFLENDEYLQGVSKGLGLVLIIHAPSTWPFPDEEGSLVPSSMETRIGIRRVRIERLGQPYGQCVDSDLYSDKNVTYTRTVCQAWCRQQKILGECGCFDEGSEELVRRFSSEQRHPCRTGPESACLARVEGQFLVGNYSCSCLNPCSEENFEMTTSQRQWPTSEYASVLLQQVCTLVNTSRCDAFSRMDMRDFSEYFAKLTVFYRDLNYENITEEIGYETEQFVSDVGGTVGLWVGLSMLSTFELAQLVLEFFHYLCYVKPLHRRQKERRRKERAKRSGGGQRAPGPPALQGGKPAANGGTHFRQPASSFQTHFRPSKNYY